MSESKLLLCTDMDRTLIPNGTQPEHPFARSRFYDFCQLPGVVLVYVTGRHEALAREAISNYSLPTPAYVISDVGTKIYGIEGNLWQPIKSWEEEIDRDWNGQDHAMLEDLLSEFRELRIQERSKQNSHKLSYYISLKSDHDTLMKEMEKRLNQKGVKASLVYSVDESEGIGLLDILPRNATKVHAIIYLQEYLSFEKDDVFFSGDSGNDLVVMGSPVPSVLVCNASNDVRNAAVELAASEGNSESLYLATGENSDMNGNYSAGILEGIGYFKPVYREYLEKSGFTYDS